MTGSIPYVRKVFEQVAAEWQLTISRAKCFREILTKKSAVTAIITLRVSEIICASCLKFWLCTSISGSSIVEHEAASRRDGKSIKWLDRRVMDRKINVQKAKVYPMDPRWSNGVTSNFKLKCSYDREKLSFYGINIIRLASQILKFLFEQEQSSRPELGLKAQQARNSLQRIS